MYSSSGQTQDILSGEHHSLFLSSGYIAPAACEGGGLGGSSLFTGYIYGLRGRGARWGTSAVLGSVLNGVTVVIHGEMIAVTTRKQTNCL